MVLVSFLIAGIVGVAVGCFFRASALIVTSFVFLVYGASVVHGWSAIGTIAMFLALLAAVQAGYICGLAISCFGKNIRTSMTGFFQPPPHEALYRSPHLGDSLGPQRR